jgi:putative flippase GtrA/LmbE family N-acetylglucosaminyl deacetylase
VKQLVTSFLDKLPISPQMLRYLLVGGSVYVLELVVIVAAQAWGATSVVAVAAAFWIGLVVSFILQKFFTFSDKRTHHKVLLKQIIAVTLLVLWNFTFTIAVTKLLANLVPAVVTRTIALLITTLWNFYLYKTSVFKAPEVPAYTKLQLSEIDSTKRAAAIAIESTSKDSSMDQKPKKSVLGHFRLWLILLATIGLVAAPHIASARTASADIDQRNTVISRVLTEHRVETLLGASWRVSTLQQRIAWQKTLPVADCTQTDKRLVSPALQKGYLHRSFGYLLTLDPAGDGCGLATIVGAYGHPDAIIVIAGTTEKPREEMLIYSHGANQNAQSTKRSKQVTAPTADKGLLQLKDLSVAASQHCKDHQTILQIVAHEDDDLLFMNPDLLHSIQQGNCVTTVYVTAGDAGSSKFYWLARERGSEAAYSELSGAAPTWNEQSIKLANQQFVTLAQPTDYPQLSLLFVHLPDGKPDGSGFTISGQESLAKLAAGSIPSIRSVDEQSVYSRSALVDALATIIGVYQPAEIRTQLPYNHSTMFSDHSDHMTAGQLATEAYYKYIVKHPATHLAYYTGYPIREQAANVEADDLSAKQQAFFTYSEYDGAVCGTMASCTARGDYGAYLERQYRTDL